MGVHLLSLADSGREIATQAQPPIPPAPEPPNSWFGISGFSFDFPPSATSFKFAWMELITFARNFTCIRA
jgi:hypothetical protein